MEAKPRQIVYYETEGGDAPCQDWIDSLRRERIHGIIINRIERVKKGNFGRRDPVGEGVWELKFDFEAGYRVYHGEDGDLVVMLCGGTKRTQRADIERAKKYWRDWNA